MSIVERRKARNGGRKEGVWNGREGKERRKMCISEEGKAGKAVKEGEDTD